jgi:hypothetical protein
MKPNNHYEKIPKPMASTAPPKMGLIQKACELEISVFTFF